MTRSQRLLTLSPHSSNLAGLPLPSAASNGDLDVVTDELRAGSPAGGLTADGLGSASLERSGLS
jgi:hypothetical protein